jgi:hypothetical protein
MALYSIGLQRVKVANKHRYYSFEIFNRFNIPFVNIMHLFASYIK